MELIQTSIEDEMILMYGEGEPSFIVPKISLYFETLPGYSGDDANGFYPDHGKVILRVHVVDQNATPHDDQRFMLAAMNDSEVARKINSAAVAAAAAASESSTPDSGANNGVAEDAENAGAISQTTEASNNSSKYVVYTSNISNSELKDIIKSTVPSMTFGSQFSAMTSVSLSSNTSGEVNNVLLLNSISDDSSTTPGQNSEMEDITVIPASARVTMLGCPLVEYGQQYFIDMGTGTTADNLYVVTSISHNIAAGKFDTSLGLTFCSNGTMSTFRGNISSALPRLVEISEES